MKRSFLRAFFKEIDIMAYMDIKNKFNEVKESLIRRFQTDDDSTEELTPLNEEIIDEQEERKESSSYQRSQVHSDKKKSKWSKNPIVRFWRRYGLTKILLIIIGIGVLSIGGYLFYLAKTAKVSDLQEALKASTVIYDRYEEEAGTIYGQKGTYVELDQISDTLENAVIATEDRSFYENNGINVPRFLLAIVTLGRSGGGSTITQQLAKNAYLSQDQTISRKAREFFLALELTKKYAKDEILTMYLNNAYFGNGVWGVEDASHKYFGVSAAELTLSQSATLAGMLKGPEIYNPLYSIENATNRRDTILSVMEDAGYISEEEANTAATIGIGNELEDNYVGKVDDYAYPSYFDAVIDEAIHTYGISENDIVNNGYKIYTELDQNYQYGMQLTFDNDDLFPTAEVDGELAEGASVALDPSDGGVRGLVGKVNSGETSEFRTFNYATQAQRSPGSTIKPLVVYTPAVSDGWSINRELTNTLTDFNGYMPENYDGYQSDTIPMYQALANSYNIPAVYTANQLGLNKVFNYGEKFGLDMSKVPEELGVALGGGVTTNPLEMAQAYSAFANGGIMPKAHLITRIENAQGEVVKSFKQKTSRVMSASVADKMTSMMLGTFSNGTAVNANVYGYTLAGKTGTTETDFDQNLTSDQWVVGYTPDVVIAQWVGFEQTDETHYLTDSSSGTASNIFSIQASYILPYTEGNTFDVENAYWQNGIASEYNPDADMNVESNDILSDLRESAEQAHQRMTEAVENANIGERVEEAWNGLVDWFNGLSAQ